MWKCQIEHDAAKEAKEKRVVFSGEEISMPHPLGFHRSSQGEQDFYWRIRWSHSAEEDRAGAPCQASVHMKPGEALGVLKIIL